MTQQSDEKHNGLKKSISAFTSGEDALARLQRGETVTVAMGNGSVTELSLAGGELRVTWHPAPVIPSREQLGEKLTLAEKIRQEKKHLGAELPVTVPGNKTEPK